MKVFHDSLLESCFDSVRYLWYDARTNMLMIRLQRIGRKNQAAFRVVVIDSHASPKAGKNVELLGSYSPHSNVLQVNKDRVLHWVKLGAQLSDTMRNLLITGGIIEGRKVNVLPRKSPPKKETPAQEVAAPVAETAPEAAAEEPVAAAAEESPQEEKEEAQTTA